jgi:hypothetical protein
MALFQNSVLKKYLGAEDQPLIKEAKWMAYFNEQKAKAQAIQADINRIYKEIDALVYELYGLTEEEIRIVEGG